MQLFVASDRKGLKLKNAISIINAEEYDVTEINVIDMPYICIHCG